MLQKELENEFHVHCFNFDGHGGEEIPAEDFSIELFSSQVISYMDAKGIIKASIFGYSMGGFVAVTLAQQFPTRFNAVITLATKFRWEPDIAVRERKLLDPGMIETKVPQFAEELKQRHSEKNWKKLLEKTSQMLGHLGNQFYAPDNFKDVGVPVLVLLGDKDKMVTLEETIGMYRSLPNGSLCILAGTGHQIEKMDFRRLASEIRVFLARNPVGN
jgi:pimeloyl-ACP methyl ester carboxylesterase